MKYYLERRYNKNGMQRVFLAGTFTTEKIKSVIKDVARTYKVSVGTVNYLTAILDDKMSWTDLMKLAATDKRIRDFIEKYPQVFEEILPIMGQARSAGIHASALIITPEYVKDERVECFDLLPIRKMGDLLVSEVSGTEIDAIGILKCDVLGIRELTRLSDIFKLIEQEYNKQYTMLEIASKYLNDPKVFEIVRAGNTQGLFQINGDGITKFLKRMRPDNINDLIALVALFRPGPLDSGAAENYVQAKRGEYEPQYLWGTYEILKDTYSTMLFQEQISQVAQKVGSLSLGDGVNLVKALSKKKLEKVRKFKEKFFTGAKANGCPKDAADKIWSDVEDAAKYSFNKCISGYEYLWGRHVSVPGEPKMTVAEMWHTMNDEQWAVEHDLKDLHDKFQKEGYGSCLSMTPEHKLVSNQIYDIRNEGVKPVYRITLANGATLDVTNNHKHPTPYGKKYTVELIPGKDSLYCETWEDGVVARPVQVASIDYLGDYEVFDVEMYAPLHNFVNGNGVVTCNSHATAYGLTAYVGAWLKTYYPTAFYTVILRDQDDDKMVQLMNEIQTVGGTELMQPDINISDVNFTADFKNNKIYWSLSRIKQLGPRAVDYIVKERKLYGEFYDLEDFIKRIFRSRFNDDNPRYKNFNDDGTEASKVRNPVTARCVKSLIVAGAFDQCEHIKSVTERYDIMLKAAEMLGFEVTEKDAPEELRDKHYYWSQQQINVAGIGAVDYRSILKVDEDKPKGYTYIELKALLNRFCEIHKGIVCATVASVTDKTYKDKRTGETKHFGKIELIQNTDSNILTIWDMWPSVRQKLKDAAGRIVIATVNVKWSDYDEKNTVQIGREGYLKVV